MIGCTPKKEEVYDPYANNDSLKLFLEIAYSENIGFKQRYASNQKALSIVSSYPNDSLNRFYHFRVANRFYNMNKLEEYKQVTNKIILLSKEEKDSTSLAKAYSYFGDYYADKFVSDSAYYFYFKAEKFHKIVKADSKLAQTLFRKCVLQLNVKDYAGCERSAYKILQLLKNKKEEKLLYETYNLLGVFYNELNENDRAIECYNKALSIIEDLGSEKNVKLFSTLSNIGLMYQNSNDHPTAIKYFNNAINKNLIENDKTIEYAVIIDNLGYSELMLKKYNNLPNLFCESLKISDSLNAIPNILSSNLHLSEFYTSTKDTLRAKKFAYRVYDKAKKDNVIKYIILSLKHLSLIDPKNATKYSTEYYKISDSIQLAERRIRNKFASIEYETEELEIEKEKLTSQRTIIFYTGGSLILLLVTVLAIRSRRTKNRELKFAKQQQEANEEIYRLVLDQQQKVEQGRETEKNRIAQELHDGVMGRLSGIRLNLFALEKKPNKETIDQCLPYINQIQEVEKEIRTIAYDLERNPFSGSTSFSAVVGDIVKSIERHSGIIFELDIDPQIGWETIDNTVKMELYRILQEALQNTVKHAKAKSVSIRMKPTTDGISVEVRDDGIGFDTANIKKGLGLKSMESRVRKIGGALQISSQPEKGTLVILDVPVEGNNSITN